MRLEHAYIKTGGNVLKNIVWCRPVLIILPAYRFFEKIF